MELPTSTLGATADASTLGVTAFNVGMINPDSFGRMQDEKVAELARYVEQWLQLEDGPAVVGLNEIAPTIAQKVVEKLELEVDIVTHDSNSVLWRTP